MNPADVFAGRRCAVGVAWSAGIAALVLWGAPVRTVGQDTTGRDRAEQDAAGQRDAIQVGLHAGEDVLYLYERRPADGASGTELRFAYLKPDSRRPNRFVLINDQPLPGTIAQAAARPERMDLFYGDGTHRSLRLSMDLRTGAVNGARLEVEKNLPDKAVPLTLSVDPADDILLAVVPRALARRLPPVPPPSTAPEASALESAPADSAGGAAGDPADGSVGEADESSEQPEVDTAPGSGGTAAAGEPNRGQPQPGEAGRGDTPTVSSPPSKNASGAEDQIGTASKTEPPSKNASESPQGRSTHGGPGEPGITGGLALVRFERGRWLFDRDLPDSVKPSAGDVWMSAGDGRIDLVYRDRVDPERFLVASASMKPGAAWDVGSLKGPEARDRIVLAARHDGKAVFLFARRDGDVSLLTLWAVDGDGKEDGGASAIPLLDEAGRAANIEGFRSATLFDAKVLVARVNAASNTAIESFSIEDGRLAQPAYEVACLIGARQTEARDWVTALIEFALIPMVVLAVLFRRRETVLLAFELPADLMLAPLSGRFSAFVLDALFTLPLHVGLAFLILQHPSDLLDAALWSSLVSSLIGGTTVEAFWLSISMIVTFCLYCAVFEALSGATPGKRLLGLSVLRGQGLPCGLRAALIRNLLKIVDFKFPPGLLLALMTINRQRIGDILARTVVVSRVGIGPVEDGRDSPTDAEDSPAKPPEEPPDGSGDKSTDKPD